MTEQPDSPDGAIVAQDPTPEAQEPTPAPPAPETPVAEPEAPIAPPVPAAQESEAAEPVAETPADEPAAETTEPEPLPPTDETPAVGPKILGVAAEPKPVPIVKKRLQEKPKREPLPWPELRSAVRAVGSDLDVAELKELFRLFPTKVREEVTENVRGFQKGARRPVSQHAAKQLARASHTARRMKRNASPSTEVGEAIGQAMAAELIASLEPERAAEVILPKRDLLEREARQARRQQRDDELRDRDEQRRRRREDAKSSRQQMSFGEFSGSKIKGLDDIAALFGTPEGEAAPEGPEAAAEIVEVDAPEVVEVEVEAPEADATPEAEAEAAPAPETPADDDADGASPDPES